MILGPGLKEAESGKRNPGLPFRDIRKRFSEMAPSPDKLHRREEGLPVGVNLRHFPHRNIKPGKSD